MEKRAKKKKQTKIYGRILSPVCGVLSGLVCYFVGDLCASHLDTRSPSSPHPVPFIETTGTRGESRLWQFYQNRGCGTYRAGHRFFTMG